MQICCQWPATPCATYYSRGTREPSRGEWQVDFRAQPYGWHYEHITSGLVLFTALEHRRSWRLSRRYTRPWPWSPASPWTSAALIRQGDERRQAANRVIRRRKRRSRNRSPWPAVAE